MTEATHTPRVRLALAKLATLFRNNVGACVAQDGRRIQYGLGRGSGDFIGWTKINGVAVFTSVEIKGRHTRISAAQRYWMDTVNDAGGIAIITREGVDDAAAQLRQRIEEIRNANE